MTSLTGRSPVVSEGLFTNLFLMTIVVDPKAVLGDSEEITRSPKRGH